MKLFLDTAMVEEIAEVHGLGLLDGVTTNPTHVSKTGREPGELYAEICRMVAPLPVSLETITLEADTIIEEGRKLAKTAENAVIKVPLTPQGLLAVKGLKAEGIRTNVTLCFSAVQAMMAAKAGADYISPFVGRLDPIGQDGMEVIREIRTIYDNYGFETEILTAAVRHPKHILEAALAGSDVATMNHEVFMSLYKHPLTDQGMEMFLNDWAKVPQKKA
jgi:transaldolase